MHKLLLLSLLTLSGVFIGHQKALAQKVADQPCDPLVYKQMSSRAWLESEREIMQNQNLIFKADSVLEYTCFDQFLSKAAWDGGDIFTHNKTFFGKPVLPRGGSTGLEAALERVVYTPFETYRDSNFNHSLLGGRGEFVGLDGAPGTTIQPSTVNQPYSCKIMADVWQKAKCMNFVHNADFEETDSFYPFETITGPDGFKVKGYDKIVDTRLFPAGMECNSEAGNQTWPIASLAAENRADHLYQFQSPLGKVFLDVFKKTVPGNCTPPILTGVTVVLPDGKDGGHADGVCSNPGCTFNKGGSCS